MTPLRTMFFGGFGALIVLAVVGAVVYTAGWIGPRRALPIPTRFARYTVNDVINHYNQHGLKTTPEKPLTRDFYPATVTIPRDYRSINVSDSPMQFRFVDIFAFDDEASFETMWNYFVEVGRRGGQRSRMVSIARRENIMVVMYQVSSTYETLLYTIR